MTRIDRSIIEKYANLSQDNLSQQMYSNITDHHQDQDHHNSQLDHHHHQQVNDNIISSTVASSLLYSLSVLKDKVNQLQSLLAIALSPATTTTTSEPSSPSSSSIAIATINMHNTIQEIIMTSSSMLLTIQHQTGPIGNPNPNPSPNPNNNNNNTIGNTLVSSRSLLGQQAMIYPSGTSNDHHHQTGLDNWPYGHDDHQNFNNNNNNSTISTTTTTRPTSTSNSTKDVKYNNNQVTMAQIFNGSNCDIIELDAADLLAKYTHYCQVCGKGFKRDANLRMHMRAHGDEYKTSAALTNPAKKSNIAVIAANNKDSSSSSKKYSCPQEGCRWNRRHAKFQPLKSMICAKNHYKRSHCPKMYVCKRCNTKQFSVLSDLRTHEKHCGDLKWQCSCGTTFSRKDKLMGHVSLFHGHKPLVMPNNNNNNSSCASNSASGSANSSVNRVAKIESGQILPQVQIDSMIM